LQRQLDSTRHRSPTVIEAKDINKKRGKKNLAYKLMSTSSHSRSWQRGVQPAPVHPLRLRLCNGGCAQGWKQLVFVRRQC